MLVTSTARPPDATHPAGILSTGLVDAEAVLQGVAFSEEAIVIPPYAGDFVTVAVDAEELIRVVINGEVYQRVDTDPEPGQYRYDPSTGELVIGGSDIVGSAIYSQPSGFGGYISDRLVSVLPSALRSYGLAGRLTYSLDTSGQNALSCQLVCRRSDVAPTLAAIKPGLMTVFARGSRWRLSSVSASEDIFNELAEITLGFQSVHQSYGQNRSGLDRPILIKSELLTGQDECAYSYTIADVAAKAGVAVVGNAPSIPVPRDVGDSETTTLRRELQSDRLLVAGLIVRWDKPTIEIVPFDAVATHVIPLSAVCDRSQKGTRSMRLSQSYNGTGSIVNGVPLVQEWQNTTLELDTDPHLDGEGDVEQILVGGDINPDIPPATKKGFYFEAFDINNLRSMGWVFDNGGKTQQRRTQRILNGTTIEETIETYGFVYTSRDVYTYSVVDGALNVRFSPQFDANTYWKKVRHEVTSYVFDGDNYLESAKSTGRELQRLKRETDNREVIALLAERDELQSGDPRYTQINDLLSAYGYVDGETQFVEVAIAPSTTYRTDRYSNYYDDVPRPTGDKPDPRFLKEQLFGEDTLQVFPDPESTAEEQRPPITMGKFQRERQFIDLLSTRNPETYQSTSETTTKEGDNLQQLATAITFQQQGGRPQEQTRLEKKGCRHPRRAQAGGRKPRYRLSSVSSPNYEGSSDSVRFTGAYTLNEAIAAAKLRSTIDNLGALTRTVPLSSPINVRPWDIVFFAGRKWRVLPIRIDEEIGVGGIHSYKGYVLELGIELSIPLVVETVYD